MVKKITISLPGKTPYPNIFEVFNVKIGALLLKGNVITNRKISSFLPHDLKLIKTSNKQFK